MASSPTTRTGFTPSRSGALKEAPHGLPWRLGVLAPWRNIPPFRFLCDIFTLRLLLPALLLAFAHTTHAADITLRSSTSTAYVGMPFTVTLKIANASSHVEPQLSQTVTNAQVQSLGQSSHSGGFSVSINGRQVKQSGSTTTTYAWQLTPHAPGPVTIAPFMVTVNSIDQRVAGLTVNATAIDSGDVVAVDIEAAKDTVYVGEPIRLTLNLYLKAFYDKRLKHELGAQDLLGLLDAKASQWGPFAQQITNSEGIIADRVERPGIDGHSTAYHRIRISTSIYPDRPGPLKLAGTGVRIVGQYPVALGVQRSVFGNQLAITQARPVVVEVANPKVQVKPIPTQGRPATWRGAVGRYKIQAQADRDSVEAGDPVGLRLTVTSEWPLDRLAAPPLDALELLTQDFDVPNGPMAGIVENGVKMFTTQIRPKRAGVSVIPAIELVSFDPDTETFVTVRTHPIALNVTASEKLAIDDWVVGLAPPETPSVPSTATASSPTSVTWLSLGDVAQAPAWRWTWPVVYAALPGLFVSVWASRRVLSRMRHRQGAATRRAAVRARRHLAKACDAESVAQALRHYVAALTGRKAKTLTAPDAQGALAGLSPAPETKALDAFVSVLRESERERFADTSPNISQLVARGREAVDVIARERRE